MADMEKKKEKQKQKHLNILRMKRVFLDEIKNIFHSFSFFIGLAFGEQIKI